jgi:DNA repair protein RecO (recombination protein O)
MGAPRTYRTEGIVLRRVNLGEADKILTLATPDHGKVRALAKAIRRPKAKLSGHLDLFCRSQLLIAKGQALDVVASAAMLDGYKHIRDDLWLTSCALYLVEFVDRFSEENLENRALYRLLVESLEALDRGRNSELLLRYFEVHALDLVGFRPELRRCLVCGREIEPEANRFGPNGVTCPACPSDTTSRPISVAALKVLRFLQASPLPTALRLTPDPRVLGEVEGQLRRTIRAVLERELQSTEFLGLVRRQTAEGTLSTPLAR